MLTKAHTHALTTSLSHSYPNNILYSYPNNILYSYPNNILYSYPNNISYSYPNNILYSYPNYSSITSYTHTPPTHLTLNPNSLNWLSMHASLTTLIVQYLLVLDGSLYYHFA